MRSFGELVQSLEFVLHARKRLEYLRGAWRAFFADRGKEEGESRMWIRDVRAFAWRAFFADRGKEEGESRMWIRDVRALAVLLPGNTRWSNPPPRSRPRSSSRTPC
jgi:hypothetical protein